MKSSIFKNGHLTEAAFILIETRPQDPICDEVYEHLSLCTECCERYAEHLEGGALEEITQSFKRELSERLKQRLSRQRSYRTASIFKMAVAAVFAIMLYTSGVFDVIALKTQAGSAIGSSRQEVMENKYDETVEAVSQKYTALIQSWTDLYRKDAENE